jgi:hypothetical protein
MQLTIPGLFFQTVFLLTDQNNTMKMRKVLILLLLPFIAQVIFVSCNCPEPLIEYYSNKNFILSNLDNSGKRAVIATRDSVPRAAFGLRLQLNREKTAFYKPVQSAFFQSAYAFSRGCPPPQIIPRDSITSLKVLTLNDFNASHLSGSEVSVYFKVFERNSFTPIEEYIKQYKTILYSDEQLEEKLDLLLMTPPVLNKHHQFKVVISMSDGRLIELFSTEINFI